MPRAQAVRARAPGAGRATRRVRAHRSVRRSRRADRPSVTWRLRNSAISGTGAQALGHDGDGVADQPPGPRLEQAAYRRHRRRAMPKRLQLGADAAGEIAVRRDDADQSCRRAAARAQQAMARASSSSRAGGEDGNTPSALSGLLGCRQPRFRPVAGPLGQRQRAAHEPVRCDGSGASSSTSPDRRHRDVRAAAPGHIADGRAGRFRHRAAPACVAASMSVSRPGSTSAPLGRRAMAASRRAVAGTEPVEPAAITGRSPNRRRHGRGQPVERLVAHIARHRPCRFPSRCFGQALRAMSRNLSDCCQCSDRSLSSTSARKGRRLHPFGVAGIDQRAERVGKRRGFPPGSAARRNPRR